MLEDRINEAQILLVDDVKENIDILNGLLSKFKRKVALDGKKALEIISKHPIDLVLLDIMMPDMDGYEVCQHLRNNDITKDVPVIFLTAKTEKDDVVRGFEVGGQDYVTKPFDPTELTARVNTQLRLRMQKIELEETFQLLKDTQSQLVHNEKMVSLGVLSAGISHEINNPINFVDAGIQSLLLDLEEYAPIRDKLYDLMDGKSIDLDQLKKLLEDVGYKEMADDIYKLAGTIREGARRTKEIVQGLKNFSRHDEAEEKLANINDGLDSTLLLLVNEFKNRIEIIKNYGNLPDVLCYPGQLNQVFMNLLSNAINAIDEKGTITISTNFLDEKIQIEIMDNGKGIPKEVQSRIFEPFFTSKEVGEGTGLGLSISYGIIEKHKGTIRVHSEIDKGTTFSVVIPVKR